MNIKPGEGERRAASGYRRQYLVSAAAILASLENRKLEWVRVADPEAGRVDDLQIGSTARIDAYQVKWEQYGGTITLNDLVRGKGKDPSLISQLSDGWKRLRRLHPYNRVVVHLVTNAYPSSSKDASIPETDSPPTPYHFASFIEQAWKPTHLGQVTDISKDWKAIWEIIQLETGLSGDEFVNFVADCCLDFQTTLPKEDQDIKAIVDLLFSTAAGSERRIQLNREDLLQQLGWSQRFTYLSVHEFPSPTFLYRPIQSTVKAVERVISTLLGGYIGVFGSPGSGKSTLLTQTLRTLPVRLIRYYAYVPEAQDPSVLRGESINFLHDVTLRLWEAGFEREGRYDPTDRVAMLISLHKQLAALGKDFSNNGFKTIILVDGLDHIAREQNPERSLLRDLPFPKAVPAGVYIILGSQTDNLPDLPPQVDRVLKQPERRIDMDRLSPTDVHSITEEAVPLFGFNERQRVFELSNGHPLALIYLLKRLSQVDTPEVREKTLDDAIPYDGDIDTQYWSHWRMIEGDNQLVYALGLISRVRGGFSLSWVRRWLDRDTIRKLQKLLFQYFENDGEDYWTFFHNSFRLFLIQRTSELYFGTAPEKQDQAYHLDLAEKYEASPLPWKWEALYHNYSAGQFDAVVALAKAAWFLDQLKALRPIDAIETDVRLALKAAGEKRDVVALIRLTLVWAALEQRSNVLEDCALPDLLINAGEALRAAESVRDGNRLRISNEQALRLSAHLYDVGLYKESQRIFEIAEPLELLSGRPIPDDHHRPQNLGDILKAWVYSAVLFRNPDEVVQIIRRIRIEPTRVEERNITEEEARARWQNWLLYQGALACCRQKNWNGWKLFYDIVSEVEDDDLTFFTLLRSAEQAHMDSDVEQASLLIKTITEEYNPNDVELDEYDSRQIEAQISLAELLLKAGEDFSKAKAWTTNLPVIPLKDEESYLDNKPSLHSLRFRLTRLQYLFGETREPRDLVAQSEAITHFSQYEEDGEKAGRRQIALAIYQLAQLWGWGQTGNKMSSSVFLREVRWILNLFGPGWAKMALRFRSLVSGARSDVLKFVVEAARQQDSETIRALQAEFDVRWTNADESTSWWPGLQRELTVELWQASADDSWAIKQLNRIEPIMLLGLDIYARTKECEAQAQAWLEIGNRDAALKNLYQLVQAARGIYSEKDYQLAAWVKWLKRVNELEPEQAEERIKLMLQRILSVHGSASGVIDAALQLLEVVFRWKPSRSVGLLRFFQEEDVVGHQNGITHILNEALEALGPPIWLVLYITTDLLIPFSNGAEPGLIEALLISASKQFGTEQIVDIANFIKKCIQTDATADKRYEWYRGIVDGLSRIGLSPQAIDLYPSDIEEIYRQDDNSSLDKNLYLKTGEQLKPEEVFTRISTLNDLQIFLDAEDTKRTKYFDWAAVVEHIALTLNSVKDFEVLNSLVLSHLKNSWSRETQLSRLFTALSKRSLELGDRQLAWNMAEKALNATNASGWDPYWDGGVRHAALRQMITVDPDRARTQIIQLYAIDLSERFRSPGRILIHLDDVFALLSEDIPETQVWPDIETYLDDLFVSVVVNPHQEAEALLDAPNESLNNYNSPDLALADILKLYLDHPSFAVGQGAVRACTAALLRGVPSIREALVDATALTDQAAERALMVLDAVSLEDVEVVAPFVETVRHLSSSPNFAIRTISWKVYSRIVGLASLLPQVKRKIPAIYNLHLPKLTTFKTEESWRKDDIARMIGDPAYILKPLDIELRLVAKAAGLPEDNVLFRALEIFRVLEKKRIWLASWDTLDDSKMVKFLDGVGLEHSFNKPHIMPARYALAYVIGELYDGGYIQLEEWTTLSELLFNYDPVFTLMRPERRPVEIAMIGGIQDEKSYIQWPENWIETAKESLKLLRSRTNDGRIILGEWTHLRYLQDEWPEEIRWSFTRSAIDLDIFEEMKIDERFPPIESFPRIRVHEYLNLVTHLDQIVVAFHSSGIETPANFWLAFNPKVGQVLGWRPIQDGWFRWEDQNCRTVVESLWWNDGCLHRYNRHQHIEVGSGWLVLITEHGFNELMRWANQLRRGAVVRRSKGWHGDSGIQYAKEMFPV